MSATLNSITAAQAIGGDIDVLVAGRILSRRCYTGGTDMRVLGKVLLADNS